MRRYLAGPALAILVTLSAPADAAPVVGPPFFLAAPQGDETTTSLATGDDGFLVAWSSGGGTWAQRLTGEAALDGSPVLIEGGYFPLDPRPGWYSTSSVQVASSGTEYGVRWIRNWTAGYCCAAPLRWTGVATSVVSGATPELLDLLTDDGAPVGGVSGVVGSGEGAWYALTSRVSYVAPVVTHRMVLDTVGPGAAIQRTVTVRDVSFPMDEAGSMTTADAVVASSGAVVLVGFRRAGELSLLRVDIGGTVQALVVPAFPSPLTGLRLAGAPAGFLAVLTDEAGGFHALPVGSDGTVGARVALAASDAGAFSTTVLDVASDGTDFLVVTEGAGEGDGGAALRGVRVGNDGTVRDPGGFDIAVGAGASVTAVGDGLWLVAAAETVGGRPLVRKPLTGRLIA